ncbi:MAG: transketolase [Chitinispirillaceae bacterium]|nr:transketolase [Chitinispirillaceae bacterium]
METSHVIEKAADNIRILAAAMVEKAKSGHPGGAMGGADFINILFTEFLRYDPTDPSWFCRDRFFLDPGHMSPMLYAQLTLTGSYSLEDIRNFRQWGSVTPGHPERDISRGIENTSGPLGQGHAMAVGAAIAERFLATRFGEWMAHKIYTYISDGGVQEEISQGAGRIAGHLGLSNLIMFYDSNDVQLSTMTSDVTSENTAAKYVAWGWNVIAIKGNDQSEIRSALTQAHAEKDRPTLIIGKTFMGKGAVTDNGESYEGKVSTHGMPLSEAGASFAATVKNLGGNPDDPFVVFPEVAAYYLKVRAAKIGKAGEAKAKQAAWEKANPDAAKNLSGFVAGAVPAVDWAAIQPKAGGATRAASAIVLGEFAKQVGNMIVSSADLANSDKTDGFLKATKILRKDDFSGAFLQAGVSELTMATLMNGIAAHGGVIPVCGTFFTFSDYMKPAVRLAALMGLPVKYVWSHDSFRVGEDGPTHQPVEHEAQIRLLEKMKTSEGHRSILVLRPADTPETVVAWKLALECTTTPCALLLSRQNIADLPARSNADRRADADQAGRGGYSVVECDGAPGVILVASGSEVGTLVDAAKIVGKERNVRCRVVSLPSMALFAEQPVAYRESVMTPGIPVFGLSAGLPVSLIETVGPLGKAVGLERFGASAPYKVLDEKFGFTAEKAAVQIMRYLDEYPAMRKNLG